MPSVKTSPKTEDEEFEDESSQDTWESGILEFECEQSQCPVFKKCHLVPTQIRVGTKNPKEIILFIGEAPGENEASDGLPFIGRSGKLLRDTIRKLNKRGASVAYTNIARYWPRDEALETVPPDPAASKACRKYLRADIKKLKPTKIVVLGGTALKALFPDAPKITVARGQHFENDSIGKVFATFHPAYILRKQNLYEQWKNDLQLILGSEKLVKKENRWSKPWKYKLLEDIDEIEKYVDFLLTDPNIKVISCDTEGKGLNKRYDNILGMFQFCHDGKNAVAIPYHHPQSGFTIEEYKRLDAALIKLFTHPNPPFRYWVFHNMEFDCRMIFNFGLGVIKFNRPLMDTMTMAYCQDENRGKSFNKPYRLESLIRDYLNVEKYGDDPEIAHMRDQGRMLEVEIERLAKYGCSDAVYTYRLFFNILERAKRENYEEQLLKLSEHWFEPVVRMNAIMGSNGMWVDIDQLRLLNNAKKSPITIRMAQIKSWWRTSKPAKKTNAAMRKRELGGKMKPIFASEGDWIFDINKDDHKRTLFFDVMGLEPIDFGKSKRKILYGSSKGKEVPTGKLDKHFQQKYHETCEEVAMLKEHQGLKKLATSYVKSIFDFLDPKTDAEGSKDSRVRPSFWVTTTDTGRSSCTEPNLQQVPRADNWAKKEIKNMYAAEPGTALIQLDFMTSEIRWWGILAQCPSLAKAFHMGKKARMAYLELSNEYAAKHPKLRYPVLEAGVALLDNDIEELREGGKYSHKALKVAERAIAKDPEFEKLCRAKKFAGIAGDLHKSTASEMYQVDIEKVTKIQRNDTKQIVFGSMFGRGAKAIAQQLNVADIGVVQGRIADFFKQFDAAEQWFFDIEDFAEQNGYVESPIGRRRRLITFMLGLADKGEIARAKRIARNSPIQGISSDGAFLGAAMLSEWLIETGKWHIHPDKECWLIEDVVHDSCLLQVPIEEVPEAIKAIQPFFTTKLMKRMTEIWGVQFNIPLEVDFEIGLKWGEIEPWDGTQLHLDYMMNRLRKKEADRMKEAA